MIARHLGRLIIVALAALNWSCAVDAESFAASGRFERTLDVSGPVTLDVETGSGSIQIRRGATTQVRVVGHIRAQRGFWNSSNAEDRVRDIEAAPPVEQAGNTIEIGQFERREMGRNVSISYELMVPDDTSVRSRTGSGSHDIDTLRGPVEAETGSGRIRIGQIARAVSASTGSGSIEVLGAGEGLEAATGSGPVTARQIVGHARTRSGSGRINVEFAGAGDGDFNTGSGSITVTGARGRLRAHAGSGTISIEGAPASDWSIDTGSGGITVRLPATSAFNLDAQTGSGSITTSHPIESVGSISKRRIQGRVRGGGPRVELSASSGSIRLD
jgi:DUF4097 and DUF4098 domain-containing protein YvlB